MPRAQRSKRVSKHKWPLMDASDPTDFEVWSVIEWYLMRAKSIDDLANRMHYVVDGAEDRFVREARSRKVRETRKFTPPGLHK